MLLYAVFLPWHGANVMRLMHHVGSVQARYSPALAAAARTSTGAAPARLQLGPGTEDWLFLRLSHEIPSYRGVPIGDRVQLVPVGADADLVIRPDGRLVPVPR